MRSVPQANPILVGLNPEQLAAVVHRKGPLLVFAGAGSGKTRVITRRIAWLITEKLAAPWQILAVTFTNKAAEEMILRIQELLGSQAAGLVMGTFHSVCARILRRDIDQMGINRDFVIFDELDSLSVLKDCLRDAGLESKQARTVYRILEDVKNEGMDGDEVAEYLAGHSLPAAFAGLFREYERRLRSFHALDFNDLLLKTLQLFEQQPHVMEKYQNQYRHVLVDEYQDTNTVQHQLLTVLGRWHKNITVVGDDDQAIYGWRGADFRNIFKLERDFPDITIITLDRNYRSTQNILSAATSVVKHNQTRHEKELRSQAETGEPVMVHVADNEEAEARFVGEELLALRRSREFAWSDVAMFFRTNAQSRVFEEAFRILKIPHVVVGGVAFYRRQEIKDLVAYLRVVVNPADLPAFIRIINRPSRGIGGKTQQLLHDSAMKKGEPFERVVQALVEDGTFSGARGDRIKEFVRLIAELRRESGHRGLGQFLIFVLERSGYLNYLKSNDERDARSREDNVMELVNAAGMYERDHPDASIGEYLESINLLSDADEYDSRQPRVSLMTLHTAKGLEFDTVFISGMEEELFPLHRRQADSDDGTEIDEERRLCYVGMTRARKLLYLTACRSRFIYGTRSLRNLSRFIREIPAGLLQWRHGAGRPPPPAGLRRPPMKPSAGRPPLGPAGCPFPPGSKVIHPRFGAGEVLRVRPSGGDWMLDVAFLRVGMKTILAGKANLRSFR
ncbi:UvrD-helicase domain-containing protein [bacterium]|nr:UvrD-helicase domain-containing protein [candidate division CSSED10-310 bacterium]